jgi:hypothetical protein
MILDGHAEQLECRITITYARDGHSFDLGMFCPLTMRHEPLGRHPTGDIERVVRDLKVRMERERHMVTFSEMTGPR